MRFTPWLDTFARRVRIASLRKQPRRVLKTKHSADGRIEALEQKTLLTAPGFVSVSPNIGAFLQDGDTREIAPQELLFQFSPGQTIDVSTLDAIRVTAAEHDGEFQAASGVTDFGTAGQVVFQLGAAKLGDDENGSTLLIQSADNNGNGPTAVFQQSTNEIQQIDIGSQITGGTFQLRIFGSTTATINFDAAAADVRNALEALPAFSPGDLIVTGGQLPTGPVTVEFAGAFAKTNVPSLQLFGNGLTNNEQQSVALTGVPTGGTFSLTLTDAANGIAGAYLN